MNSLAHTFSVIFHPLLLLTYLLSLLAWLFPAALYPVSPEGAWSLIGLYFVITFVLPGVTLGFFRLTGVAPSLTMKERHERIMPFVFISLFYAGVTILTNVRMGVGLSDGLMRLLMVTTMLTVAATIITLFFKVSVHALSIWGFTGILFELCISYGTPSLFYGLIGAVLIAGIVMTSRLQLGVHSLTEVFIGAGTGLTVGYLGMTWL